MKSFYKVSLFLLLLTFGIGGLSAIAQDQPSDTTAKKECAGKRNHGNRFSQIPGLTEEQKNQIDELKSNLKAEIEPVREELKQKEDTLRTMQLEYLDSLPDHPGHKKGHMKNG